MGKVENPSNKKSLAKLESQIVNLDLVAIKDKVPVANTKHLEEYEKELIAHTDDMIKNTLDIEIIEEEIKNRTTINSNFKEYRLGFTKPLTSIPKMFTPFEKSFDEQKKRLQVRVEEMKESTFKIAEAKIKEVLNSLQEQHKDIEINMSVFDSFIEVQRKVKGMLPNDKNVLPKASTTKIETEFNKHVAPILEAKRVKEQSELEHKQFQNYLPDTNSNNINELEAVKLNLLKQKEVLPETIGESHEDDIQEIVLSDGEEAEENIELGFGINASERKIRMLTQFMRDNNIDFFALAEYTKA